jgi:hypothetical protein
MDHMGWVGGGGLARQMGSAPLVSKSKIYPLLGAYIH